MPDHIGKLIASALWARARLLVSPRHTPPGLDIARRDHANARSVTPSRDGERGRLAFTQANHGRLRVGHR